VLKKDGTIQKKTSIRLEEFLASIHLILNSTFFSFNNKIYKQVFDAPIGSPLSPIIANMVM